MLIRECDLPEALVVACGHLQWSVVGDAKGRIADWWLSDILPADWCQLSSVKFGDGSVWPVWTW